MGCHMLSFHLSFDWHTNPHEPSALSIQYSRSIIASRVQSQTTGAFRARRLLVELVRCPSLLLLACMHSQRLNAHLQEEPEPHTLATCSAS